SFLDGTDIDDAALEELEALSEKWNEEWTAKRKRVESNTALLSDVLYHPSLFKAYPMMARVPVTFEDIGSANGQTVFAESPAGKKKIQKIIISNDFRKSVSDSRILSVLMHEVQHAIQQTEGFAMGGSQRTMDVPRARHHAKMHEQMLKLEEEIELIPHGKDILYAYDGGDMDALEGFPAEEVTKVENIINRMAGLEKRMQRHRNMSNFEAYRALSGEVEARNVQKRLEMSAEERKASLASATEDVAREDQIIMREGLSAFSDDTLYQRAWHGTPHNFDAFTLAHIGSGEGAQEAPRASVTFSPEDGKAVVEFFKNADATSLPHEMFHIFRREQL
ncbi:MAG: hypothetical protein ACI4P0_00575, partial [Mailhella sp.]